MKWKGLRDTYRRELKKQRSMATVNGGFENTRDPSWAHYSSMNFLREYMGSSNNQTDLFQFSAWSAEDALPDCDTSPTEEAFNSFVSRANLMEMDIPKDGYTSETPDTDDEALPSAATAKVKEEPNNMTVCVADTSPMSRKRRSSSDHSAAASPSGHVEDAAAADEMESTSCTAAHHEKHTNNNGSVNSGREAVSARMVSSQARERKLRTKLLRKNSKGHSVSPRSSPSPGGGLFVAAQQDDSDDDLYFFKSLIPYVKSLSPTRKLCLRAEIHNLVLREIMSECNTTPTSVIPLEHVSVGLNA